MTALGLSPTLARALLPHGAPGADLSSLRTFVTTGEPWNPEPYRWLFEDVGGSRVPVINCTGGTEVGACFLSPTPVGPIKACSVGGPALGMAMDVVDDSGASLVGTGDVGELVCRRPFPGMTRGFWRDPDKFIETYWSRFPGVWVHGDWASVDADGYWFLHGRSDDTLNIAGKRIGPAELESAAVGHPAVREAAAIGVPHEVKGETAWIFACLLPGADATGGRRRCARRRRARQGVQARSDLLRRRAAEDALREDRAPRGEGDGARHRPGDLSSLENPESLDAIQAAVALSVARRHRRWPRHRREHRARARRRRLGRRRHRALARADRRGRGRDRRPRVRARRVRPRRGRASRSARSATSTCSSTTPASGVPKTAWEQTVDDWWNVFEINVLGVYLCCARGRPGHDRARLGAHRQPVERRGLPARLGVEQLRTRASKSAVYRFGEVLNQELDGTGVHVFTDQPGARAHRHDRRRFPDDAPWTPPELAPELVRKLATGRYDALAGRYLHAEHDDVDDLLARADEVREHDLNAIRLRR